MCVHKSQADCATVVVTVMVMREDAVVPCSFGFASLLGTCDLSLFLKVLTACVRTWK